jgi:hypothetical protein
LRSSRESGEIEQIGILLVGLSRLVGEMIEGAVGRHPDVVVVGRDRTLANLRQLARATQPDVVVFGQRRPGLPEACREVLLDHPRVKALGIDERGGRAYLFELQPKQAEIGEVSPDQVVEEIRRAVSRHDE